MNNKIQIYHVNKAKPRFNKSIFAEIAKHYDIEVHKISLDQVKDIASKKVHLVIFDNIDPKDIKYSELDPIQANPINKHLHTAVAYAKLPMEKITLIYEKHIDYFFESSYDDYYMIAKTLTILKRKSSKYAFDTTISFKNIKVDKLLREVYVDGKIVDTTRKEYLIIEYLVAHSKDYTNKDVLFKNIWGYEEDTTKVLNQYLHRIKTKIGSEVELAVIRNKGIKLL